MGKTAREWSLYCTRTRNARAAASTSPGAAVVAAPEEPSWTTIWAPVFPPPWIAPSDPVVEEVGGGFWGPPSAGGTGGVWGSLLPLAPALLDPVWLPSVVELPGTLGRPGTAGMVGVLGVSSPPGAEGVAGGEGVEGVPGVEGGFGVLGGEGVAGGEGAFGGEGVAGGEGVFGGEGASGLEGASGELGASGVEGCEGASGVLGWSGVEGWSGVDGAGVTVPPPHAISLNPVTLGPQRFVALLHTKFDEDPSSCTDVQQLDSEQALPTPLGTPS